MECKPKRASKAQNVGAAAVILRLRTLSVNRVFVGCVKEITS